MIKDKEANNRVKAPVQTTEGTETAILSAAASNKAEMRQMTVPKLVRQGGKILNKIIQNRVNNLRKELMTNNAILRKTAMLVCILAIVIASMTGCSGKSDDLKLANKYFLKGQYDEAITTYEKIISKDSDNVEAYKGLARAYLADGSDADAENALKEALKIDEKDSEIYLDLAILYISEGRNEEALALLEEGSQKTNNEGIKELYNIMAKSTDNGTGSNIDNDSDNNTDNNTGNNID